MKTKQNGNVSTSVKCQLFYHGRIQGKPIIAKSGAIAVTEAMKPKE